MGESERVFRRLIDLANELDADSMQDCLAGDLRFDNPVTGPTGKAGMHQFHKGFFAAFPDFHYAIERVTESGPALAVECTVTGTHRGDLMGIPPTHKRVDLKAAFFLETVNGKVTEWHSYFDTATMMRQLGVLPEPTAAQSGN